MTCICVSKTGLIVSGSGDKTIAYWNLFNQDGTDHETALNLSKTLTGTFLFTHIDHSYSYLIPNFQITHTVSMMCRCLQAGPCSAPPRLTAPPASGTPGPGHPWSAWSSPAAPRSGPQPSAPAPRCWPRLGMTRSDIPPFLM